MRRRAFGSLLLIAVIVVCLVGTGSAVQQSSSRLAIGHADTDSTEIQQETENAAQQEIQIAVQPNGSGIVTVRYRTPLAGVNETIAFERLRANITANPAWYRTRFGVLMNQVVTSAETTTGREMKITDLSVNATRRANTGVVTYSFVWTNIAATDGNHLYVGDALSGFYLENGTQLVIAWSDGYEPTTVRPTPDERRRGAVQWNAPATFGKNEPFVELAPVRSGPNDSSPLDGSDAGGTDGTADSSPLSTIAFIVVLGVLAIVAWMLYRDHRDERDRRTTDEPAATSTDVDGEDTGPPAPPATDESQVELLSNEERVIRVLERAGGRAKQQQVVEELGWSEAKASKIVGRLREEGTVTGFRLGRENIVILPEEEQTGNDESTSE